MSKTISQEITGWYSFDELIACVDVVLSGMDVISRDSDRRRTEVDATWLLKRKDEQVIGLFSVEPLTGKLGQWVIKIRPGMQNEQIDDINIEHVLATVQSELLALRYEYIFSGNFTDSAGEGQSSRIEHSLSKFRQQSIVVAQLCKQLTLEDVDWIAGRAFEELEHAGLSTQREVRGGEIYYDIISLADKQIFGRYGICRAREGGVDQRLNWFIDDANGYRVLVYHLLYNEFWVRYGSENSIVSISLGQQGGTAVTEQSEQITQTAAIRNLINEALDDQNIINLAYDHFKPAHDDFAIGMTRGQKIQILLDYCQRTNQIESLLQQIKERNPNKYHQYEAELRGG